MATKQELQQKKIIAHDLFRAGFSQIEISKKIGISEQSISRGLRTDFGLRNAPPFYKPVKNFLNNITINFPSSTSLSNLVLKANVCPPNPKPML